MISWRLGALRRARGLQYADLLRGVDAVAIQPQVIPACFRHARPRALRGQGAAGIQLVEQRTFLSESWMPDYSIWA